MWLNVVEKCYSRASKNLSKEVEMKDNFSSIHVKEKPQICAIDLDIKIVEALRAKGLHCFDGTLGPQVEVREYNDKRDYQCQLNLKFPPNLHEYDILIVDLQDREPIQYIESEHISSFVKGSESKVLLSKYPETIFDPRPLSLSILGTILNDFFVKETLTIVFCSANQMSTYYPINITFAGSFNEHPIYNKSLYEFMPFLPQISSTNKTGKNVVIADIDKDFTIFLHKYRKNFTYEIVFQHPKQRLKNSVESIVRKDFVPLLLNGSNEIVGFKDSFLETSVVLAFPQLYENKKEFLLELIDELLPGLFPNIFPYSEQFSWLNSKNYLLPNQANIIARKNQLEDEYKTALTQIEKEFQENRAKYKFLHDLITETAEVLVKSVETFFTWLGFENIVNMDETNPKIREEDIQINLGTGLLVIEVKGIGGTSTDSNCAQIGKIKNRRAKERNRFDVFGLYIVNHQRYLPPTKRQNPPFNDQQIADAELDERGLLTTYEIFKLYSYIENGFITKEDARNSLSNYGLVKFKPSSSRQLGYPPLDIHFKGEVVKLKTSIIVNKGASIIVCNDEDWFRAEIVEIRVENKPVEFASGEISVKVSRKVLKTSELWLGDTK
jgi:hypothetical protein